MAINIGPRISPPAQWVADYQAGVSNNKDKWLRNTTNPSKDPLKAAAAAKDAWENGVKDAVAKNRFQKGVLQANPDAMIATIQAVGADGYEKGVQARAQKVQAKVEKLSGFLGAHVTSMDALPTATAANRRDKMLKNLDGMLAIGDKMKGG
jgi:hypothetical protein